MENFETYKDIRTVASVSALIGVATMSIYFQNEISKIKTDLNEVQKHLATIIPAVDPNSKQQLDQVIKAIRVLDSRVATAQSDLRTFASTPSEHKGKASHDYVRFTKSPHPKELSNKKEQSKTMDTYKERTDYNYDELEDDIAAMM